MPPRLKIFVIFIGLAIFLGIIELVRSNKTLQGINLSDNPVDAREGNLMFVAGES